MVVVGLCEIITLWLNKITFLSVCLTCQQTANVRKKNGTGNFFESWKLFKDTETLKQSYKSPSLESYSSRLKAHFHWYDTGVQDRWLNQWLLLLLNNSSRTKNCGGMIVSNEKNAQIAPNVCLSTWAVLYCLFVAYCLTKIKIKFCI